MKKPNVEYVRGVAEDYLFDQGLYTQAERVVELCDDYERISAVNETFNSSSNFAAMARLTNTTLTQNEILRTALEKIRNMYLELSHDKVYSQRNEMIIIAANALMEAFPPTEEDKKEKPPLDDNF